MNKIPKETNKAIEMRVALEKERDKDRLDSSKRDQNNVHVGKVDQTKSSTFGEMMQVYNFQKVSHPCQ